MHQHPCGNAPDFARHGTCVAQAAFRRRHDGWRPDDLGKKPEPSGGQYSSASMTVITRTVTAGSVGSGEW